ncbi:MAG TPA: transcription termination factor NusA [Bacteroidales bacterium]|nr:transcription termination factor NusA [Bacteroidales bacterium]HQD34510.1 transcription termination factor NusA [Bacteroidales bacterium]
MATISLLEAFNEFQDIKGIDKETLMELLDEIFKGILEKKYGDTSNFYFAVNPETGDIELWRNRVIVPDGKLEDPNTQIELKDALRIEPDFMIGEEVTEPYGIENFSRREIQTILQMMKARITEFENQVTFDKYNDQIGELVVGEVHQVLKNEIIVVDEDGIELILTKDQMIPRDHYKKGDTIRASIYKIENRAGSPYIYLSRTSTEFLAHLMEQEVPEIADGLITIRKIARIPGVRAKVAVESYDDRIDPVGACVGIKGSRIFPVIQELRNENIDVINFSNNPKLFIQRALAPAKITDIQLEDEKAIVIVKPDQISFAIGKNGQNIELASRITGYDIEVYRELEEGEEEDIDIQEFSDVIDQWIINQLKTIGCDTAKKVLSYSVKDLADLADFEEETVEEIQKIIRAEFE